jgi:hypothetical protein
MRSRTGFSSGETARSANSPATDSLILAARARSSSSMYRRAPLGCGVVSFGRGRSVMVASTVRRPPDLNRWTGLQRVKSREVV